MTTSKPREPLKWEELSHSEQRGTEREISRIGKNTASGAAGSISKLRQASYGMSNSTAYKDKTAGLATRLEGVQSHLKDKPITLKGAASRRAGAWDRAVGSARKSGGTLPGSGWYLEHAGDIHQHRGDIPFSQAAAASAALSPGKDPKADEIPAFKTLAGLHHGEHTITVGTGRAAETQPVHTMSAEQLGQHLTTAANENSRGVEPTVTSSHPDLAAGGRAHRPNTVKAIKTMRGQIGSDEANPPETAPKTASYERSIVSAGTASDSEKLDYRGIAHHAVHGDPNQGMMQFSRPSPGGTASGILSPEHHTAEDTWMQGISSGQKLSAKYPSGRTMSPAKRAVDKGGPGAMEQFSKRNAGLPSDKSRPGVAHVHAFNNKATRMAAAQVGPVGFNQHGENINVPSVMMQEVSWTQARREAGGDAPHNQAVKRQEKFAASTAPQVHPGQRKLAL